MNHVPKNFNMKKILKKDVHIIKNLFHILVNSTKIYIYYNYLTRASTINLARVNNIKILIPAKL